jgi:hypothetical protein
MKTIKTINGQMCICTPVQLAKNISELDVKPFVVKVPAVIQAVTMCMQHCMEELEEKIAKDLIVAQIIAPNEDDTEELSAVRYSNGGCFSQLSYRAMEQVIEIFNKLETSYVDARFLETLSILQLNQIKKALVSFYGKWNTVCSFIEEIELYKMSQQGQ